jgi:translation initiation factor eIF-2B subunit epsilon
MPLFGQILAALYQMDIVEEDDIRAWHVLPTSQGSDLQPGELKTNVGKTWIVGAHMIHQLDEQESDEDESEDEEEANTNTRKASTGEDDEDEDEDEEESE